MEEWENRMEARGHVLTFIKHSMTKEPCEAKYLIISLDSCLAAYLRTAYLQQRWKRPLVCISFTSAYLWFLKSPRIEASSLCPPAHLFPPPPLCGAAAKYTLSTSIH